MGAVAQALLSKRLRLWLRSSREALDLPQWSASLLGDLSLLLLDELAGWLIAVEIAQDLHRHESVRSPAAILEDAVSLAD